MKPSVRYSAIAVAATAFLAAGALARAETWPLELKRLGKSRYARSPQTFYTQVGGKGKSRMQLPGVEEQAAAFGRIVKKEPRYESEHPLRGVAKLGSQEYAFALDIVAPKPKTTKMESESKTAETPAEPDSAIAKLAEKLLILCPPPYKPPTYNRLYFDFNCNGDLTDDKVVEAESLRGGIVIYRRTFLPTQGNSRMAQFRFPQIDVTIDAGGTKLDYSFLLSGYVNASPEIGYAVASLGAAVYREGDITLNGKKRHVVLVDFNSNGRFDDETTFLAGRQSPDRPPSPETGDVLLVDPDGPRNLNLRSLYDTASDNNQFLVSKLVNLDGRFYDMKISPAGDQLSLTPTSVRLGSVTNPNDGFLAMIYSDKGSFIKISGNKGAPVPEGEWKLLSYTINRTGYRKPAPPSEKKKEEPKEERSALLVLVDALEAILGSEPPRYTGVKARAMVGYKPVMVRAGETVTMPFGPPYTPVVTAAPLGKDKKQVRLAMSLVGSGGEKCIGLRVNGGRPPKPQFTITDPEDKIVQQGNFEYG